VVVKLQDSMRKYFNEDGSTLVFVAIVTAITMAMGATLLAISMNHFRIKISYSEIRKSFYIAEDGLNRAYLRVLDLICEASVDSLEMADDYLLENPDDLLKAATIFKDNYKSYITANIINRVYFNGNPHTEVVNKSNIAFMSDELIVKINSKYVYDSGVEKSIVASIAVYVPDYFETKAGETDFFSLISYGSFDL
jgi:hypothetical protein